ncbi:MAG TPA: bifunctional phosphopantothenoylcysteine decarboxylase/phosphopantothenate--cysteine ligase CoaBC [Gammaproteobacteria bacterium]|nr:bifunctional phosphopantothenoylcysteine decarboxylase/phosphopantothenate--cysteine ligase CoaBC [Gammaproteobacteria bacterium]
MNNLLNKRIVLGVSGGIAAYKSADLVRRLRERGADVRVVMTRSACEFITPLTMQALSGHPVHTDLLDPAAEAAMGHIELARWADVIHIAPASANMLARLAHGQADDLLSTLCLATTVPITLAPAMNQQMWLNPATQANLATMQERGMTIFGPADGSQACGESGPGRMLEPEALADMLSNFFQSGLLQTKKIIVTAGPTREEIDPVRFISNRSSGRMGYALAQAAVEAGADVMLVSGPTSLPPPERVRWCPVTTAQQMRDAVMADLAGTDIFIAVAAVADYRCKQVARQKIKKSTNELSLLLEKNPDILAEVAAFTPAPFTLGFAAETDAVTDNARSKLQNKNLDMIAANQVGDGMAFDTEENRLQVLWQDGDIMLERASKDKLARQLINLVAQRYYAKHPAQSH